MNINEIRKNMFNEFIKILISFPSGILKPVTTRKWNCLLANLKRNCLKGRAKSNLFMTPCPCLQSTNRQRMVEPSPSLGGRLSLPCVTWGAINTGL